MDTLQVLCYLCITLSAGIIRDTVLRIIHNFKARSIGLIWPVAIPCIGFEPVSYVICSGTVFEKRLLIQIVEWIHIFFLHLPDPYFVTRGLYGFWDLINIAAESTN